MHMLKCFSTHAKFSTSVYGRLFREQKRKGKKKKTITMLIITTMKIITILIKKKWKRKKIYNIKLKQNKKHT